MPNNKIVIAAGGTGGHLYPGIALAIELREKGYEPLFIVKTNDIAKEILEKAGFKFEREISAGTHHYGLIFRK